MGDCFVNSNQQIVAELAWLELLIKREITLLRFGKSKQDKFDEFSGLYVSEEDIDKFLNEIPEKDRPSAKIPEIEQLDRTISVTREYLNQKAKASQINAVELRLSRLIAKFGLDSSEIEIFLACLAPDVDLRFQKYFAYLQNDVSKRRPTIQLLRRFGINRENSPIAARSLFGVESRLFAKGLLILPQGKFEDCFPLLQPRVPASVADFLAGIDRVDDAARAHIHLARASLELEPVKYYDRHRMLLDEWLSMDEGSKTSPIILVGAGGSGKSKLIHAFAAALAKNVLTIDFTTLADQIGEVSAQLKFLERDAALLNAVIHVKNVVEIPEQESALRSRLTGLTELLNKGVLEYVIISSNSTLHQAEQQFTLPVRSYEIPLPSIDERIEFWCRHIPDYLGKARDDLACDLATRFAFTPEKVHAAARRAVSKCARNHTVTGEDYFRACRLESNQNLQRFGKKMKPIYRWADLVVPQDTKDQLLEICNCVRHKRLVYETWGFGRKYSLGKGLNVLFAGASGTGKTMCAEIIATDLELDVFKIDLSCVVSKYVGETERNLSQIFDEAETSNSILFFDEADALFGKRSEVKDAHDRYANIEINYLLQRLDDYSGVVVLASNLRGNLDKAFTRRLNFIVEFPIPDEIYRRLIWSQVFPGDTPLGEDVKFDFLAKKFKLSGGNIKNIAVNSAFLASGNGHLISMEHLILATKREYQKLGRLCTKSEFGPYFNLVQETSL